MMGQNGKVQSVATEVSNLNFNNLFKMDKELALKINEWATCVFWKNASLMHCPFVVTLDEIREDAFWIDASELLTRQQ